MLKKALIQGSDGSSLVSFSAVTKGQAFQIVDNDGALANDGKVYVALSDAYLSINEFGEETWTLMVEKVSSEIRFESEAELNSKAFDTYVALNMHMLRCKDQGLLFQADKVQELLNALWSKLSINERVRLEKVLKGELGALGV